MLFVLRIFKVILSSFVRINPLNKKSGASQIGHATIS